MIGIVSALADTKVAYDEMSCGIKEVLDELLEF